MKRVSLILALLLLGVTVLAGCAGSGNRTDTSSSTTGTQPTASSPAASQTPSAPAENVKLTVWLKREVTDITNQMIEERIRQFAQENNIEVETELIPYENMLPRWTAAIESGNTPDISFFQYQEVGQFYQEGHLLELTDVNEEIQQKYGKIFDSLLQPVTFQGKQYAVPQKYYAIGMFYRKDLLEKAGYQEPPKTWDEFRTIAKAVTDPAAGVYGAGIGLGKVNSDGEWLNQTIIWAFGGSLIDKDSKTVVANRPETVQALKFISDMFKVDKSTPPSAVNWDDAANNKAYLAGQAAMVVNTGTLLSALRKDDPELLSKTGVAKIPAGPAGQFVPAVGSYLGVFKNTKHPDWAKKLLVYLSEYEWYKSWVENDVPANVPIYEKMKEESIWQDPLHRPFIESIGQMTFLGYPGEYTPKAGEVFNARLINDALQSIIVQNVSPEEAAERLQKSIEEIYSR